MPTGPKGQKRPRDPHQLAKLIVDIATGQVEDREPTPETGLERPSLWPAISRISVPSGRDCATKVKRHG